MRGLQKLRGNLIDIRLMVGAMEHFVGFHDSSGMWNRVVLSRRHIAVRMYCDNH